MKQYANTHRLIHAVISTPPFHTKFPIAKVCSIETLDKAFFLHPNYSLD